MFCTQCGKEIENGTICEECAEKLSLMKETTSLNEENGETPVVFVEQPTIQAPVGNRKAGLTKAIVGAVIGFIASSLSARRYFSVSHRATAQCRFLAKSATHSEKIFSLMNLGNAGILPYFK